MISFSEFLEETKKTGCTCWTGYKRKPGTKPCSPGSCVKEETELKEEHIVHVDDGSNYGDKPHDKDVEHVMSGVKKHNGEFDGHSDKGAYFKFKSQSDARNFADHVKRSPHKTVHADLHEAATADAKGYKSSTGGLTQKGRDHFNAQSGGHLKAPVTTPPSKLKAGSKAANRRKSFCARMSGMEGPMKKPNGEPTRKALSLRKWNC